MKLIKMITNLSSPKELRRVRPSNLPPSSFGEGKKLSPSSRKEADTPLKGCNIFPRPIVIARCARDCRLLALSPAVSVEPRQPAINPNVPAHSRDGNAPRHADRLPEINAATSPGKDHSPVVIAKMCERRTHTSNAFDRSVANEAKRRPLQLLFSGHDSWTVGPPNQKGTKVPLLTHPIPSPPPVAPRTTELMMPQQRQHQPRIRRPPRRHPQQIN